VTPRLPATPTATTIAFRFGAPAWVLDELRSVGFSMLATPNNHSDDFGIEGMLETVDEVEARGFTHAGCGASLSEARAPGYLDTGRARIALIAVSSSDAEISLASDGRGVIASRGGINPLRFRTEFHVSRDDLAHLKRIDCDLGTEQARAFLNQLAFYPQTLGDRAAERHTFLGKSFVAGDHDARVSTSPHPGDLSAIAASIQEARRTADVVVVSIHAHESAGDGWNMDTPADFIPEACRAFVDAGADAVFGHGPHRLRAIEVYNCRPIFYSLGNFFFMDDTVQTVGPDDYRASGLPADSTPADLHGFRAQGPDGTPRGFHKFTEFWESVLARVTFREDEAFVELFPVKLANNGPAKLRGVPLALKGDAGRAVLERLQQMTSELSETEIEISDDASNPVGRISMSTLERPLGRSGVIENV
jgi:poly-gamma-glutamate capsule biosynthesis protein CapA/YwtB (metallophosphatase superfamily)